MFKKTAMIAGLGLVLSATAHADTYNWEAGVAVSGGDIDGVAAGGSYFFHPVDDGKGPLGEAEFIDRASHISIAVEEDEIYDVETDSYGISGRYVMKDSGWIFDAAYLRSEPDSQEIDAFNVGVGKYIAPNTTLVLGYLRTDVDNVGDADSYLVELDHLANFGNSAVKFQAAYAYNEPDGGDDFDIFNVGAIWYPCNDFGIGADYTFTEQPNGDDIDSFGVSAEYFLTRSVSISLNYNQEEGNRGADDTDVTSISVAARF